MAVPHENRIRERLAQRLDVLEPGLRFCAEEYVLANTQGTGGRIDILARDQHRMWVAIELKRANQTAREAAQEITKYAELLRQEKRLRADRIRVIVVALEPQWAELLAPLSNLARDWHHDLRGYSLRIDEVGTPLMARRVDLLPAPLDQKLTSVHHMYLFEKSASRDECWGRVIPRASEAHVDDLIGVALDYGGEPDMVRYPFALYIALGRVDQRKGEQPCLDACSHYAVDADERDEHDHPDEYTALCHVTSSVLGDSAESGYPDKFTQLVADPDWQVAQVRTSGAFSSNLYETDDLINALRGNEGGAQVLFHGSASTKVVSQWREFRQAAAMCLAGNDDWIELVGGWLDIIGELPYELDVTAHIFNPCDLVEILVHGSPHALSEFRAKTIAATMAEYVPMVYVTAVPPGRDRFAYELSGMLRWNGRPVPNLRDCVERVYPSQASWWIARFGGTWWQNDRDLLRMLGLRYVAEWTVLDPLPQGGFETRDGGVLLPSDLGPETVEGWGGLFGLASFVEQHRDEVYHLAQDYGRGRLRRDTPP
ncbi:endonuclease NucS domain-containing protein [Nonomuraea insulae]|uniref:Endonuclease NucS domain-containing protein n=1 Tax=Nonomuraea insulae TaxID=1616787 RepID=A0ABW1CQQ2_9ACTN